MLEWPYLKPDSQNVASPHTPHLSITFTLTHDHKNQRSSKVQNITDLPNCKSLIQLVVHAPQELPLFLYSLVSLK